MTPQPHVERAGDGAFGYTLHGGTKPVAAQWLFREQTQLPVAVNRWTFPPGATEGVHVHPPAPHEDGGSREPLEEIYVLVRGRAAMLVGEQTIDLSPGDAVLTAPGTPHGVRNDGPDDAEFLVIWGQAGTGLDWNAYGVGRAAAAAAASDNEPDTPGS